MKRNIQRQIIILFTAIMTSFSYVVAQEPSKSLKVMTYNIWNGFDWDKDTIRKKNWIGWIQDRNPDVLALQELCGYNEDKLKVDAAKWGHNYVQILKTEGYPVGITSKKPITVKERVIDTLWHGLLHCETYGIDFFVVHLSPADSDIRLNEAKLITKKINELNNESYIILGDFNAQSPIDASWVEKNQNLKAKYIPKKKEKYSNLRLGEFDYSVISEFLACPSVDVCLGKIKLQEGYTFPTSALIGKYNNTLQTIVQNRVRIDYILASPTLAKNCSKAKVFNQKETGMLSDHYPILAEFNINKE